MWNKKKIPGMLRLWEAEQKYGISKYMIQRAGDLCIVYTVEANGRLYSERDLDKFKVAWTKYEAATAHLMAINDACRQARVPVPHVGNLVRSGKMRSHVVKDMLGIDRVLVDYAEFAEDLVAAAPGGRAGVPGGWSYAWSSEGISTLQRIMRKHHLPMSDWLRPSNTTINANYHHEQSPAC